MFAQRIAKRIPARARALSTRPSAIDPNFTLVIPAVLACRACVAGNGAGGSDVGVDDAEVALHWIVVMPAAETLHREEALIIRALAAPVPQQLLAAPVKVQVDALLTCKTAAVVAIVALVDVFALEVAG